MYSIGTIFVMVGFFLSTYGTWTCNFFEAYRIVSDNEERPINLGIYTVPAGFDYSQWTDETPDWEDVDGWNYFQAFCTLPSRLLSFNEDTSDLVRRWWNDSALNWARGFAMTSNVVSLISWVVMWCGFCCGCSNARGWRVTFGIIAIGCCVMTGMSFLVLNSELFCTTNECRISRGGTFNIIAMVFFGVGGILCVASPDKSPASPPMYAEGPNATSVSSSKQQQPYAIAQPLHVQTETVHHANGTIVSKKVTTHPDGSKTVEETIQKSAIPDLDMSV